MQTLIIGDIHGCYREFLNLLDVAALSNDDKIISVGDLVDRGPDSPSVLAFFRENKNAFAILGNHERKHVRAMKGELSLAISQRLCQEQFSDDYPEAVTWMENLPLFIDLEEATIVHGFLEPGILLNNQQENIITGTISGERYLVNQYDKPWYELYEKNKPVIVGHLNYTRTDQPLIYKDIVYGLDTSCVNGYMLTGLLLPSFKIVQVQSKEDYWTPAKAEYLSRESVRKAYLLRKPPKVRPKMIWDEESLVLLDKAIYLAHIASDQLIEELNNQPKFAHLSRREQAQVFAKRIEHKSLQGMLSQARIKNLSQTTAKKMFRNQRDLITAVQQLQEMTGLTQE